MYNTYVFGILGRQTELWNFSELLASFSIFFCLFINVFINSFFDRLGFFRNLMFFFLQIFKYAFRRIPYCSLFSEQLKKIKKEILSIGKFPVSDTIVNNGNLFVTFSIFYFFYSSYHVTWKLFAITVRRVNLCKSFYGCHFFKVSSKYC